MITETDTVRLIDFGLSKASNENRNLKTMAGTPLYMAPEVFKGNYGMKADIWSIGIILYTMVTGHMPFEGANPAIKFKKIAEADIDIDREEFKNVSEECKDLIKKIFVLDVDQRCSAMTAL